MKNSFQNCKIKYNEQEVSIESGEYKELCHSGTNQPSPDFPERFGVVDRNGEMELRI